MDWRAVLAAAQSTSPPAQALADVVAGLWPGARVADVQPIVGGLSSVLHRIDVVGAPVSALVLRQLLPEFGHHGDTVRHEAAAHALAVTAGLPVPAVHWSDGTAAVLGRPALLLDLVPGRPLVGGLVTDAGRVAMAGALQAVAGVRVERDTQLPRLTTLEDVLHRFGPVPTTSEVVDARAVRAAVADAAHAFAPGSSLVHMDLHAGNVLWDGAAVTGILDWPGAGIGNPLADEAYLWLDTFLAHGADVADALQAAVDAARPGAPPPGDEVRLWRGIALLRALPSPDVWAGAYRAMGVDVDDATVVDRFVRLVEDHLGRG